jgi:Arc/MetJ family transcription regulator
MSVYARRMARMVRTNIVIDDDLLDRVMSTFGLGSKRAAVDFALHAVLSEDPSSVTDPWKAALELQGTWADRSDDELREIYGDELPDPDAELGRR